MFFLGRNRKINSLDIQLQLWKKWRHCSIFSKERSWNSHHIEEKFTSRILLSEKNCFSCFPTAKEIYGCWELLPRGIISVSHALLGTAKATLLYSICGRRQSLERPMNYLPVEFSLNTRCHVCSDTGLPFRSFQDKVPLRKHSSWHVSGVWLAFQGLFEFIFFLIGLQSSVKPRVFSGSIFRCFLPVLVSETAEKFKRQNFIQFFS